jgi:hypothetical protein
MILFNSITQFEIQPERTKRRVKRDDLDTLTEIWVGPTDQEDIFVPQIGHQHPDFNLMSVIDTSIKRMPADVSEITINYQGKLDNSGTGFYTSVPAINQSWMEGEVSYQTVFENTIRVPTGTGSYYTFPQIGINTWSRRYTGRCVEISYITSRRPTGSPTQIGISSDFLGFTNIWEVLSSFQPGSQFNIQGTPIEQMVCTDVKVEDRADGWYRVSETYQSRQLPGAAIKGPTFSQIGVGTNPVSQANPQVYGSPAFTVLGAAQGAATASGATLPSSAPGTPQSDTTQSTGIDPAWGDINNATLSAAAAGGNNTQLMPSAQESQPLGF